LVERLMMKDFLARLNPLRAQPDGLVDGAALDRRLAGLAEAADLAEGRLSGPAVTQARSVAERAQARRGLSEQLTVVAFAGSTGAGKSTLFNSIVGEEVAKAGVLRPTTSEPLAAIWRETPETIALLQWLGVLRWHVATDDNDTLADLVLIDLPDHDSTSTAHRAYVDHFVERVDLMVWVLDPQKYADALVHEQYLRRFSRHDAVTVVVLSQVDRLPVADAQQCLAHLRRLVAEDGLSDAVVLGTSNRSGEGLEALAERILTAVGGRRTAVARLAADVATAADGLAQAAEDPGTPLTGVRSGDLDRLTDALTEAAGAPAIASAIEKSSQLKAAQVVGWPPLKWLGRLRKDPVAQLRLERPGVDPRLVRTSLPSNDPVAKARANTAVMDYVDMAGAGAPRAWVQSARAVADAASASLADNLDQAVTRAPLVPPRNPRWWSVFGVLQWLLFAVALAGGLWLLALAGFAYLQFHVAQAPRIEGFPVPTLLLVVGLLGGVVLAVIGRMLARTSAKRAAKAARAALRVEVAKVAEQQIAAPVDAELATLEQFRRALATARDG
jgi:GTP-binding protein EngB required for normal cell division